VRAALSAVATTVVLVAALALVREGLVTGEARERRWMFLEQASLDALGLTVEVPQAGAWTIVAHEPATGARALFSAAGDPAARSGAAIARDTDSVDGVVSTRCRPALRRAGRACGVLLRHRAPASYYLARVDEVDETFEVIRSEAGVVTRLAEAPLHVHGGWYAIALDARGRQLRAIVDGGAPLVVEDDALTSGRSGLWAPADAEAYFDELSWTARPHHVAPLQLPFFQLGS